MTDIRTTRAGTLPKSTLTEIKSIITGIRKGTLIHDQGSYHCGTAHCIAGWKVVRDVAKYWCAPELKDINFAATVDAVPEFARRVKEHFRLTNFNKHGGHVCVLDVVNRAVPATLGWGIRQDDYNDIMGQDAEYAQNQWGLSYAEADYLFDGRRRLHEMEEMIENWEKGLRMTDMDGYASWVDPASTEVLVQVKVKPKKFC